MKIYVTFFTVAWTVINTEWCTP